MLEEFQIPILVDVTIIIWNIHQYIYKFLIYFTKKWGSKKNDQLFLFCCIKCGHYFRTELHRTFYIVTNIITGQFNVLLLHGKDFSIRSHRKG